MHRNGHIGAALAAYSPVVLVVCALGMAEVAVVGAAAVGFLSTLPDLDMRIPFLDHRGPTHTVWFAVAVGGLGGLVGAFLGASSGVLAAAGLAVLGFSVGLLTVLSHVAADAVTPAGVRPLAPYRSTHVTLDLWTSRNPIANYLLLALGGAVAFGAFVLGNWLHSLV